MQQAIRSARRCTISCNSLKRIISISLKSRPRPRGSLSRTDLLQSDVSTVEVKPHRKRRPKADGNWGTMRGLQGRTIWSWETLRESHGLNISTISPHLIFIQVKGRLFLFLGLAS